MKEKGSIGKILKLKSENLGINHFDYIEKFESEKSLQPEERVHYYCLHYLDRIRVRYSYDILYMYPFYKSEICDLNRWQGIRLKEHPKKNMQLKSLFTVPKNCLY